jgi:hypothetical protein
VPLAEAFERPAHPDKDWLALVAFTRLSVAARSHLGRLFGAIANFLLGEPRLRYYRMQSGGRIGVIGLLTDLL